MFWLEPGDESAWLSPNGPYKQVSFTQIMLGSFQPLQKLMNKIKRIATTGADGVWLDVPVYFDTLVKWSDHSHWAADAFRNATSLDIPDEKDWNNPVSRICCLPPK